MQHMMKKFYTITNENDLRMFTEYDGVMGGFTRKPDTSDARRNVMVSRIQVSGGCVVKPILVHGKDVAVVTEGMITGKSYLEIPDTDAVVTNLPNVVLTTTHADCIPLYAYDTVNKVIGVAHAGWKGTSSGIAQELIEKMINAYGCNPADISAYIGPGICKEHFEFGKDYAEECFASKFVWMKDYIIEKPLEECERDADIKVKIDLKGINKHFFELAKVGKVQICDDCTYCDERYYSFRRAKDTERMLAYMMLK